MSLILQNIETNRPITDYDGSVAVTITDCTFDSPAVSNLPDSFSPGFESVNFSNDFFVYDTFGFINPGSGSYSGYPTGIGGLSRYGVGAFYFFVPIPNPDIPDPIQIALQPCEEPAIQGRVFWDFISTFWDFLDQFTREVFENYWHGLTIAGESLLKKATRLFESTAPENARTCVLDDYYDIRVGPFHSKHINLDPTLKMPNFTITPIRPVIIEPAITDEGKVYLDLLEVSATDYYKIRDIALNTYIVIQAKSENVPDKYFKVNNLLSSEEKYDRPAFCQVDETVHIGTVAPVDEVGRLGITLIDHTEDASEYHVTIYDDPGLAAEAEITWAPGDLKIKVNNARTDPIEDILTPSVVVGTPWANISNRSPWAGTVTNSKRKAPIISANVSDFVIFSNLPLYTENQENEGRYYPIRGRRWVWFEGHEDRKDPVVSPGTAGSGEYVETQSKHVYMVQILGDLTYLEGQSFTAYFTTGRSYEVHDYVTVIPELQLFVTPGQGVPFKVGIDYTFDNHVVEFHNNIFETGEAQPEDILYCVKTPLIEHMLFEQYGSIVGVPDWLKYNYNNYSGKAGINGLLLSIQEASDREDYERALNIYYGLPITPGDCEVEGLYESYGYPIKTILGTNVTLDIPFGSDLHPFIQKEGQFHVPNHKNVKITSVIDRTTGTVAVDSSSGLNVGDKMYLRLTNRFLINGIRMEDDTDAAEIDIYDKEGPVPINHMINVIQTISDGNRYPEILVFGTRELNHNYDGIYHVTNAKWKTGSSSIITLTLYKRPDEQDPLYNDYIGGVQESVGGTEIPWPDIENVDAGFVHIPWSTHKFLRLIIEAESYYNAYLDAPIDTIYDSGDNIPKYQRLARNVSVLNHNIFPGWFEYDNFRRYNGVHQESNILELTSAIIGAKFGQYFPSGYSEVI